MDRLVRDCIKDLVPYNAGTRDGQLLLDANETGELPGFLVEKVLGQLTQVNRYPGGGDELKARLAEFLGHGLSKDNIVLTNGGDGGIGIIANTFLNPGDEYLTVEPTFSMYKFYCSLAGANPRVLKSGPDFCFPVDKVKKEIKEDPPKLLFICSPNNPTGGTVSLAEIEEILDLARDTVVVVDNAYIEFGGECALPLVSKYPNLIVLRTFSKALGLAGLRIGYLVAQERAINYMKRALPPFLVSSLALRLGEVIIDNPGWVKERVSEIITEREFVYKELLELGIKVYPSQGNFIFVWSKDEMLGARLKGKGIVVRDFGAGKLRISVGSKGENRRLLEEIAND